MVKPISKGSPFVFLGVDTGLSSIQILGMETKENVNSLKRVFLIQCPDSIGLIHKVTSVLLDTSANIVSNHEFVEPRDFVFFMRTEFTGGGDSTNLRDRLISVLPPNSLVEIKNLERPKVVILATKEAHCLGDLLLRARFGELEMDIQAVISNHDTLKDLAYDFHIPFHCISHENLDRSDHEIHVSNQIQSYNPDWIILAKYMRILSPEFVSTHKDKMVNIHHSFLPAFIGAKPYEKAYARGVKIVGATAHFVTENLDEGPILVQDVIHVDHADSPERLALFGKDLEKVVLAKAIRILLEHRVMVYENRTIIFD